MRELSEWIEIETIDGKKIFINSQNVAYVKERDKDSSFVTFNYAATEAADNYVIVKGDCRYVTQFFDVLNRGGQFFDFLNRGESK